MRLAVIDGNGRLAAMLDREADAAVRTDLVLPEPEWRRVYSLATADCVAAADTPASTWSGTIAMDAVSRLEFTQTVRELQDSIVIGVEYRAQTRLDAAGLFFRLSLPWIDFKAGSVSDSSRAVILPECGAADAILMQGKTSLLAARSPSGALRWSARFNRKFAYNLQDKSDGPSRNFTFWVSLHRGSLPAGTAGAFDVELAFAAEPDDSAARLSLDLAGPRYRFDGFGGNYCFQLESPVTAYTLDNLESRWARTAISLIEWDSPEPDRPGSRLRLELELMRELSRKGIPLVASIWRLPERFLAGRAANGPDANQRRIDPRSWDQLLESLGSYMLYARDRYGVEPELFSFNEPDLGIGILFTAEEHCDAVRRIGAHFQSLGLKTRMLLGDVSHPRGTHAYVGKTAEDPEAMRYAGALSFHSWGGATPQQYESWANLAGRLRLPLLVAELGADASAWHGRSYDSYRYGMEEIRLCQELLLHAKPRATIYWEFTADYSLVRLQDSEILPTGRFWLTKHLTNLTPPDSDLLSAASDHPKVLISAFSRHGAYAIHLANLSAARHASLTGLPPEIAAWRAVLTTAAEGFRDLPALPAAGGRLSLQLPARSLLTLFFRP